MKLTELSVNQFLDKLISNEAVPGGGSIAALNGAIAASLAGMVAGLTIGRKKYAEVEGEMLRVTDAMKEIQQLFIEDVDLDSLAYTEVMKAYKLPKDNEEEIQIRTQAIEEATKEAARIPLLVARRANELLPFIKEVADKGNQNAFTDACVAMMCCRTAILGAGLNVRINLQSIYDVDFVQTMQEEIEELEHRALEAEQELLMYAKKQKGL